MGVRGLMDAYFASVDQTVSRSELIPRVQTVQIEIYVTYEFNDTLINQLKQYRFTIRRTDYTDEIRHLMDVEKAEWDKVALLLEQHQSAQRLRFGVTD